MTGLPRWVEVSGRSGSPRHQPQRRSGPGQWKRDHPTIAGKGGWSAAAPGPGAQWLHALGLFRPGESVIDGKSAQATVYTQDAIEAVDRFRAAQGWQTTVPGLVDSRTIERLWKRLEEIGRAAGGRRERLVLLRVR